GATRPRDGAGRWGVAALAVFLLIAYAGNLMGPPPPSIQALWMFAIAGSAILLIWSWWADSHRDVRYTLRSSLPRETARRVHREVHAGDGEGRTRRADARTKTRAAVGRADGLRQLERPRRRLRTERAPVLRDPLDPRHDRSCHAVLHQRCAVAAGSRETVEG